MKTWRVCGVFIAVFLLGTLVLHMSFFPSAHAQSNTLVFSDSFQSGTELTNQTPAGAWDGNYLPDGTPGGNNTLENTTTYEGDAWAANFTAMSQYQFACVYKNLTGSYLALESSTMVYLSRIPLYAVLGTTLCENYDEGVFFVVLAGGYWGIDVLGTDYYESVPSYPSADTWYNVTLYGQEGFNGVADLWVNGALTVELSGLNVLSGTLTNARDEFWLDQGEASPISCYSDNITVYSPQLPPISQGQTGTFGYTSVGSDTIAASNSSAGTIFGYHDAPSFTGTVDNISAYVYAQSGTADLAAALYLYSTGVLLAETNEITVNTTAQWNTLYFISAPVVTAGTQYWLVWWQDAPTYYAYDTGGSSGVGFFGPQESAIFPYFSTFLSLSSLANSTAYRSIYATYSYNFTTYASLTVGVSGYGATDLPGVSDYYPDSNVSVLATPNSGYALAYWLLNGTDVGSANPYTVNMTGDLSLTAVFNSAVYLSLSVFPSQTYTIGQSTALSVTVINEAASTVNSTLTLTITGPGGYGYYDFDKINAWVGTSCYSFCWTIPLAAGTYIVEVSLVPMQLTAYDCAWLSVGGVP